MKYLCSHNKEDIWSCKSSKDVLGKRPAWGLCHFSRKSDGPQLLGPLGTSDVTRQLHNLCIVNEHTTSWGLMLKIEFIFKTTDIIRSYVKWWIHEVYPPAYSSVCWLSCLPISPHFWYLLVIISSGYVYRTSSLQVWQTLKEDMILPTRHGKSKSKFYIFHHRIYCWWWAFIGWFKLNFKSSFVASVYMLFNPLQRLWTSTKPKTSWNQQLQVVYENAKICDTASQNRISKSKSIIHYTQ